MPNTPTAPYWGATESEWQHFSTVLGSISADLLPVVSNPHAEISGVSKMTSLGKTPSQYTSYRKVVGLPKWTSIHATPDDIARWSRDSDLGICLQTRQVRGLDIDIPDAAKAYDVVETVQGLLDIAGITLPMRYRRNTGKLLLAFRLAGEHPKRAMEVDGGIIEFLANGQQFVAIGTHPSGGRYHWQGGLPTDFPVLPLSLFEEIWATLERDYSIAPTRMTRLGAKPTMLRAMPADADPVALYLETHGHVLSVMQDGRLNIACPFASEHTSDSGETATQYFQAGTGGFAKGHFRCLHAHCSGRVNEDYLDAIGYTAEEFDVIPADTSADGQALSGLAAGLKRDSKGRIVCSVANAVAASGTPSFTGSHIAIDRFRDELMLAPTRNPESWRSYTDADYTRLRITLESKGFEPVGRELIRDAVALVGDDNAFDSAILWLSGLEWDGVPRVEGFLHDYLQAEDTPYTRAVSRYMWTALAGRVLVPGCVAEMVPVLVGEQGARKTSAVRAMAPHEDHFVELALDVHDNDLARKIRGKLVGELGELKGLGGREAESIKQWLSRTHEEWTPKYREFTTKFPRRCLFVGTTNQPEFLADETGERRWLPVDVGLCDPDGIKRDCLQLWAEGRELFHANGVYFREAETLARGEHARFKVSDVWCEVLAEWLDGSEVFDDFQGAELPVGSRWEGAWRSIDILQHVLGVPARALKKTDEMRLARVWHALGFARTKTRIDKHTTGWVWKKEPSDE